MGDLPKALRMYERSAKIIVESASNGASPEASLQVRELPDGEKCLFMPPGHLEGVHARLKSDPAYAIVMNNIGACLAYMGKTEEARSALLESIEFIPEGYPYRDPYVQLATLGPSQKP